MYIRYHRIEARTCYLLSVAGRSGTDSSKLTDTVLNVYYYLEGVFSLVARGMREYIKVGK